MTTSPLSSLSPIQVRDAVVGGACLVDIRGADEFAREHIAGAINLPLDQLSKLPKDGRTVVFHCRSGMRTAANADTLVQAAGGAQVSIMEGGIEGWRAAGLPTAFDKRQPIEVMRQVQIIAGSLVMLGVLLGVLVAPGFFALSAFVGAGLTMAGLTGWCGMAKLLAQAPWNKRSLA